MKKLLYIASICIASLFSACDDYLTVESPDQLTSSSFWRNQSDAEAGLAAAYSQLYLMTYSGGEHPLRPAGCHRRRVRFSNLHVVSILQKPFDMMHRQSLTNERHQPP